jgi:hypothetical protein
VRAIRTVTVLAVAGMSVCGATSLASEYMATTGDYGGVGLLQTRNARLGEDGQFNVGVSTVNPYNRIHFTWQVLPRLEATFRYSELAEFQQSVGVTVKDRGADFKFLVLPESYFGPAVAVGVQDAIGTGTFASEYVVLSKRFYDLDVSFGMAWGYAGTRGDIRNPLTYLSSAFDQRDSGQALGGVPLFGQFMSGRSVGLFGGVEYHSPIKGLTFKVELDANDYSVEPGNVSVLQDSPINIGMVYRPFNFLEASVGFERGNELMFRLDLRANFQDPGIPNILDSPRPTLKPRSSTPTPGDDAKVQAGSFPAAPSGVATQRTQLFNRAVTYARICNGMTVRSDGGPRLEVVVEADRYVCELDPPLLAARAARASAVAPESVVVSVVRGGRTDRQEYSIQQLEQAVVDSIFDLLAPFALIESVSMTPGLVLVDIDRQVPFQEREQAASNIREVLPWPAGVMIRSPAGGTQMSITGAPTSDVGPSDSLPSSEQQSLAEQLPFEIPALRDALAAGLDDAGLRLEALQLENDEAVLFVTPRRYRGAAKNVGVAATVAANELPDYYETITIATTSGGVVTNTVSILRKDLERSVAEPGVAEELFVNIDRERQLSSVPGDAINGQVRYPNIGFSFSPALRQHIGAPENFYLYQLWLSFRARAQITRNVSATGILGADLYNNFHRIERLSNSGLPHVRSDIREYLQQGENNIVQLHTDAIWSPLKDVYARASVGYLETMYGGISAELLFHEFSRPLAIGFEANYVRQREYEQLFGFRDYQVFTGHADFYYKLPFYNMRGQVSVGQYLAGDRGATFELSREFDTGIRLGAFATFTNVSAEQFGEGSFDKGIYMIIPFDIFTLNSTRAAGGISFRPLTRDGGQRLSSPNRLYGIVEDGSLDRLTRDWDNLLR